MSTELEVDGKHIFLVGGGGGIGLALMRQLVPKGASITFATKDPAAAKAIVKELEGIRIHPSQKIACVLGPMRYIENAQNAIKGAIEAVGTVPDMALLTGGFAEPGYFVHHTPELLEDCMHMQYWGNCWPAHILAKELKAAGKPGKIVFINNIHAESTWTGYSAYAPGKYALKGLADVLREELAPFGIKVTILLAPGGFEKNWDLEASTKPEEVKKLDEEHNYRKLDPKEHATLVLQALHNGVYGRY